MSDQKQEVSGLPVVGLWLCLVVIASYMSQPLLAAWSDDPSLKFGVYAFPIWLISVVVHWRFPLASWPTGRTLHAVLAAGMLFLGILGELQAMVYLALALLLSLPITQSVNRIIASCIGILWTPFWSWSMGPFLGTSINTVSLGLAVVFFFYSVIIRVVSNEPKANNPAL